MVLSTAVSARGQAPQVTERHADLPGVRLFYVDSGGMGIPVVFLHAATGTSQAWEHQVQPFVSAGYRFIAYDRRGHGRSVIDKTAPQPGTAADDLQALMSHLRIDRFHVVGTAAGGIASLDYALAFPQRLRSLVVANSIGGVQDEDYLALGRRIRPAPQFDALPADFRELGPSYRAANPEGTRRWNELERLSHPDGSAPAPPPTRTRLTFARLETLTAADTADDRGRRPLGATGLDAPVCRAHQARRNRDRARERALGLLGAAGDVQPPRPRVHSEALT